METIANKINEGIKNSDVYKEYLFYKDKVENDQELIDIKRKLEMLKKEVCKDRDSAKVEQYYSLEKKYESNSIVKEYLNCKERLNYLLKSIADILTFN